MFNDNKRSIFNEDEEIDSIHEPEKKTADLMIGSGTLLRRSYNIQKNEDFDIITEDYDPYENKKSIFCTDSDVETMRKDLINYGSKFGVRFKESEREEIETLSYPVSSTMRDNDRRETEDMDTETISIDGLFCHPFFPLTKDPFSIAKTEPFKIVFEDLGKSTFIYVNNFMMDLMKQKRENRGVLEIQVGEFRNMSRWHGHISYKSHCKRILKGTNKELDVLTFAYTEGEFIELRDTVFLVHIALEKPVKKKLKPLNITKQLSIRMNKSGRETEIDNEEINKLTGNFFFFVYDTSMNSSYVLER